jgi:twitching motility protein PilT
MQTQKGLGNRTLNDSLVELVKKGVVDPKEAYIKAVDKAGLVGIFERNNVPLEMAEE